MRLRIVSDGTSANTHVTDEHGNRIRGVQSVQWTIEVPGKATAALVVKGVAVNVAAEAERP